MSKAKKIKKGFTIVEVSLIIIVLILSAVIAFPYIFNTRPGILRDYCRNNRNTVIDKMRECIHKHPESEEAFRGMKSGEICEFLLKNRIIKSDEIFRCPSSSSRSQSTNDYRMIFNGEGKFIGVECGVDDSHNNP